MGPRGTSLAAKRDQEDWRTPAEVGGYRTTPNYAETLAYLDRLGAAHPEKVRITDFGTTAAGYPLKLVVVSKDGVFDPERIHASGRAILLVQNSIHSGEMDGKDACLALLRDLLRVPEMAPLLDRVAWTFVPVYNIDGHERRSAYGRINQNGPEVFGWRANGANLNLNRDYLKADAPETRAFLRLFHQWLPDFFVDNHVTDGSDFQYDVTFALDATPDVFPETAGWLRSSVTPELERRVNASGHLAFPAAVFLKDDTDPTKGLAFNENPPRFSTGQMILENRPGLLVELHMLKDYRTRVTGNYEILRALLEILNRDAPRLIALNAAADRAASQLGAGGGEAPRFPLVLESDGQATPVLFHGYDFQREPGSASGTTTVRYGSRPTELTVPMETGARVALSVVPPAGYIVPPQWTRVIEVLAAHDVRFRRTRSVWTGEVGRYRCSGMEWPTRPFEGRHPILRGGNVERAMGRFGVCKLTTETVSFAAGSVVAPLDQRLAKVVIHWLEPEAPDSALRWGFFDSIFEQKEGPETYVLEDLYRRGALADPATRAEFEARLRTDAGFTKDPAARLSFLYDRSPWGLAQRVGEYPVGRLSSLDGLPLG
jgi:Zinc carboxypeptidase